MRQRHMHQWHACNGLKHTKQKCIYKNTIYCQDDTTYNRRGALVNKSETYKTSGLCIQVIVITYMSTGETAQVCLVRIYMGPCVVPAPGEILWALVWCLHLVRSHGILCGTCTW